MSPGQDSERRRADRRLAERRRSRVQAPTGPWSDLHRPLRTLLFLLIAAVLIQIYRESEFIAGKVFDVLLLFVFAAIIALLLTPLVDRVQRARLLRGSRSLAVLVVNLALLVLLAAFLALLIPSIVSQASALGQQAPQMMNQLQGTASGAESWFNNRGIPIHLAVPTDLNSLVAPVLGSALQIASGVLGGLVNLLLVAVIALYLQIQGRDMIAALRQRDHVLPGAGAAGRGAHSNGAGSVDRGDPGAGCDHGDSRRHAPHPWHAGVHPGSEGGW